MSEGRRISYLESMYNDGYLIIQISGLLFILDGTAVDLLKVAHDHHLPLALVFRNATVDRPSETISSLLVEIVFLRFSFDYNRIIALCLLQVDKELPSPLSECVIIGLVENLSFEDGAPVLQYLCLLTLFGL